MNADVRHYRLDYLEFRVSDKEAHQRAMTFYANVFGWQYKEWGPEYADTPSSGITSGIAVDPYRAGQPMPVVYAADLEDARKNVIAAGAKLTKDIFAFPGGRRFQFVDPADNEIGVWSEAEGHES